MKSSASDSGHDDYKSGLSDTSLKPWASPIASICIPQSLNLYSKGAEYYLGEHRKQPLLAVTWDNDQKHRATGDPNVILYGGASKTSSPLATYLDENWTGERWAINLSSISASPKAESELIIHRIEDDKLSYKFTRRMDNSNELEDFEWRYVSHSPAVRLLKGSHRGWELLRLSKDCKSGQRVRDNKEILAVCCQPGIGHVREKWKIMFLGDSEDGLGSNWEILVLITALALHDCYWKHTYKLSIGAAGGGIAGTSSGLPVGAAAFLGMGGVLGAGGGGGGGGGGGC
ncbi:hypothetical protein HJFPF1_04208 [Paramyrothecium foliicola]|nr:hypothetical protein HJFPF1_04208 [Paramyrothecium foliicola]